MEKTNSTTKPRSREEILSWIQQARERKEAFQCKVDKEWMARQKSKKDAEKSGYYNLEWI